MKVPGGTTLLGLTQTLLFLFLLACGGGLHAVALDVTAGDRKRAEVAVSWCATARDLPASSVIDGGCPLRPLRPEGLHPGIDHRAFWMRLELVNPGPFREERWLEVGHPRLFEVMLCAPGPPSCSAIGSSVPLTRRDPVGRRYGVLALHVPPDDHATVWVRVASDTLVDLTPTLWEPEAYRIWLRESELVNVLGLGSLLPVIFASLVMFGIQRQRMFLFYALATAAVLLNDGLQNGLLQRYAWPEGWTLPIQLLPFSYLVTVAAYVALLYISVPGFGRFRVLHRLLLGCMALLMLALLYAIGVDYSAALPFWYPLIFVVLALALLLMFRVWRAGSWQAGILCVGQLSLIVWGVFRLLEDAGWGGVSPVFLQVYKFVLLFHAQLFLVVMLMHSRNLRAQLKVARAESEARVAFLAQMSHELRAPLDTVLGNAQLIARAAPPPLIASRVAAISDSGRQLLRLIDDLLDYARGLAGRLRIELVPIELHAFLRGVERNGRMLAARQGNRFELKLAQPHRRLAGDIVLRLDGGRLRQVLDNLLGNAARYTRNGRIVLDVTLRPLFGESLRIEFAVSDSGEGIAPADQKRIFQPFERAGRHDRQGAGLGLAISRQLVELMGGRIGVESQPGQGACFQFWIEAAMVPSGIVVDRTAVEAFEAIGYTGHRRHLLLVDHDEANRMILAALLRDFGFVVDELGGVVAAGSYLASSMALDLVLMNQFMPDGSGWTLLESLARLRPGVPALMISAAPPTPPSESVAALCAGHFLRPLDHAVLLCAIGDLLGLQWLSDAREVVPDAPGSERPDDVALGELARLSAGGELTAIIEWAVALKANSPRHGEFADRVLAAAKALDFVTLEALAARPGQEKSPNRSF